MSEDVSSFLIRGMWAPRDIFSTWDFRPSRRPVRALRSRRAPQERRVFSVGIGTWPISPRTGFMRAAQTLKSTGSFAGFASLVPYAEINGLFEASRGRREAVEDRDRIPSR